MNNQLISIIMPVYDGQDFLDEALSSIRSQTYSNFEVIIVNDCSTDNTFHIAKTYCEIDKRFMIYENEKNLKLPKSLNIGHSLAKGDYITWTSHDNILKPSFLKVLYKKLITTNVDLVYSNYDIILDDGKLKRKHITKPPAYLPFGNVVGASFMYTKRLYEKLEGYSEDLYLVEDYDFWLRALCEFNLLHISDNLYKYRLHKNSLTSSIANNKRLNEKHKRAIGLMFENLITERTSGFNYAEMLSKLYFGNLEILLLNKLLSFKKEGNKIFNLKNEEWNYVIDEKIREFLYKSEISKMQLAKFLITQPKLLSLKYNRGKTLQLLKKIIK
ncbi:glycosyltransferase [Psychroflexus sp. CAK57W]|uniref:glycosyltransferase family 2 protein n=1 Tax=Psychroflexus curvus TaxID=2873595 RepID=UPI001CCB3BF9|nr:glycosyltransferase [Psychroflexus curvus]MBZ9787846.1 glycosyltransferase [Psychroflexus curvus]